MNDRDDGCEKIQALLAQVTLEEISLLATPATALMGAAVNGAALAYLWQRREEGDVVQEEP